MSQVDYPDWGQGSHLGSESRVEKYCKQVTEFLNKSAFFRVNRRVLRTDLPEVGKQGKFVSVVFIGILLSVLLVVGFFATSARAQSSSGAIRTVSFSDTTFSNSAISVTIGSGSISLVPGSPSTIEVQISSHVTGPFMVGLSSEGNDIQVGMILQGYPTSLPSGLSAQFPNGASVRGSNQTVVPIIVSAAIGTASGTVPLELIVYQQQGPLNLPAAYTATIVDFSANIGG